MVARGQSIRRWTQMRDDVIGGVREIFKWSVRQLSCPPAVRSAPRSKDATCPHHSRPVKSRRCAKHFSTTGVVFFRQQQLNDEDQVRFTAYFGKPVPHVRQQRPRRVKEIFLISNVKENGEPIGELGDALIPLPLGSFLSTAPRHPVGALRGGDSLAGRPDSVVQLRGCLRSARRRLENPPQGNARRTPPLRRSAKPPRAHCPPHRPHPSPKQVARSLYVGPHLTKYVVGLSRQESDALLGDLYAHLEQPRFVWTHEWQVGDLVLFDNRPTMHRRLAFPPDQRRLMKRTQVFNDEIPVEDELA